MLVNEGIIIDGVSFWASPYTPQFCNWAFMKYDYELTDIWKHIPDSVDVLITHGPPYDILDSNSIGKRTGCVSLRKRIETIKPKVHVFGHIHENGGESILIDNTLFVNASVLNEYYHNVNKPTVVDI